MKTNKYSSFKRNSIATSIFLAMSTQFAVMNAAYANGAFGPNTDITGASIDVPTYYANSPSGYHPSYDFTTHDFTGPLINSGKALRKFVDGLPGLTSAGANDLNQYLGVAVPEKWVNMNGVQTNDDYYEIAIVEYVQKMHSDLAKATHLRGYVQLETPANGWNGTNGSKHYPLTYPDGSAILDTNGNQVYAFDKPNYLGPVLIATRGTAIRIKYYNYLPVGSELFIPVDRTVPGAGLGFTADGKSFQFPDDRADIHWHGGDTPWISDGTPHQWIAPAGDPTYAVGQGKGPSAMNVPDMPDPGPGANTLYFPNNMSGRFMFYHDHTSALTRLNVYLGLAAGYVVRDPAEEDALASIGIPGTLGSTPDLAHVIPLVIQDKTFVPDNIGPAGGTVNGALVTQSQDAKWDLNHWGQPGDLWFPHVYETNQDPNSIDGTNPVGRWDWGPWFWPVFPSQYSLPTGDYGDVTTTPEAFMDTPIVNGTAYPTLTVDPTAYQFRILNAANDRSLSLNMFVADPASQTIIDPNDPNGVNTVTVSNTEVKMVPATPNPNFPSNWPTDGRAGGVPDPATAGPDIVQIGTEGGLLPVPAIWPAQPMTYDQNVRSITMFNVLNHGLLLGGAERADVVIDFSKYAGKTLILYNDAPAPMPGFDPRIDYYTGNGDQADGGGAFNTQPGYGPNTRTIMQIKVNPTITNTAVNPVRFNEANFVGLGSSPSSILAPIYAKSQPRPIVPESIYNAAFGTSDGDNYAQIYTGSLSQPNFQWTSTGTQTLTGVTLISGGTGYLTAPTVQFIGGGGSGASATAMIDPLTHAVTGFTNFVAGSGYTSSPAIQFTNAPGDGGSGATAKIVSSATVSVPVINKAIQELFDPIYGRMNATLGVELPYTSATVATTIPLNYIDPPNEQKDAWKDDEVQIWKITHNGVDSHPVHVHLTNAQVVNRIDWAGVVKPPQPNEVGWKETIRMNPLEDIILAFKPMRPILPFGLPRSKRLLDPSQPPNSQLGFTQIDPLTGQAPAVPYSNVVTDFDNEYVFHCHILGHEEFDFMRPLMFHPKVAVPDAPTNLAINGSTLSWTDPTPAGGSDATGIPTLGNIKNEIGFYVQQSTDGGNTFSTVATVAANKTSWTDPSVNASNSYQVIAYNSAGNSTTIPLVVQNTTPAAPTGLTVLVSTSNPIANLNWIDNSNNETGFVVQRQDSTSSGTCSASGTWTTLATTPANVTNYIDTTGTYGSSYCYRVYATNATGSSAAAMATTVATMPSTPPVGSVAPGSPSGLTQILNPNGTVTISWDPVPAAATYLVTVNGNTQSVTNNSITLPNMTGGNVSVVAVSSTGTSSTANSIYNGSALDPVGVTATPNPSTSDPGAGSVTLMWANNPLNVNNVSGISVSWVQNGIPVTQVFNPTSKGLTIVQLNTGNNYNFTIQAMSNLGNSSGLAVSAIPN